MWGADLPMLQRNAEITHSDLNKVLGDQTLQYTNTIHSGELTKRKKLSSTSSVTP